MVEVITQHQKPRTYHPPFYSPTPIPCYNTHDMSRAQEILFGHDSTEGIVAVEVDGVRTRVYRRVGGGMVSEEHSFTPWMLTTQRHDIAGAEWEELEGEGYKHLAKFSDRKAYENARYWIRDSHAANIILPSAVRQFLTLSGKTLFKGMAFEDVVRMQLDIETATLSPNAPDASILMVAISDNTGFETVICGDEPTILRETIACIRERDPDIIEGHNIYDFDLQYLATRAKKYGIRLAFGRDGSEITFGQRLNCAIGYYSRPFTPAHIHGRHILDTLLCVQRYDVAKASLSSYSLKYVAKALGFAEDNRDIIPHNQIASEWKTNPERVKAYAIQDVRETRLLAELVCPPEFYLTQMLPDTFSHAATSGTGEKINSILIRQYLHRGQAIPEQTSPTPLPGGYTEVRSTGVINRIVKCDVESLYPSIMLRDRVKPSNDTLDVFLPALEELTKRRFAAKKLARESEGRTRAYWDGMQSAFKILINSFYGYLAGPFNFNDYTAAARVTTTGQRLVKLIVEELEKTGSVVIEIDTDGVFFQPPAGIETLEQEVAYIEKIGSVLPEGIRLAHDGRFKAMISLKMKNYVLATYDGRLIFKGSALRSRADEPFGLKFISDAAECLLSGQKEKVKELYQQLARRINAGELAVDEFARRERVTEKTFTSSSKKRLAAAAQGAKVGDYVRVYQRSDGSIGLVEDYNHDEDRHYLLDKLYKFASRLAEAYGPDFATTFPKPSAASRKEAAGQQTLGLFD